MTIIGLDGKTYNWNPASSQAETNNRSSLHIKAKTLLSEVFKHDRILEEISLPGTKSEYRKTTLRGDLFIPNRKLLIEVHGEQHHKFNNFFFKNKLQFFKAKARDSDKKEWCKINDIEYIELNYNEDIDEWRRKIQ
jgi:hypothetical protein